MISFNRPLQSAVNENFGNEYDGAIGVCPIFLQQLLNCFINLITESTLTENAITDYFLSGG
jgi:hypothetical protein